MKQARKRAKKILSIDQQVDRLKRKIDTAMWSVRFFETRLKSLETGVHSIHEFDAKESFLLAVKHIATHQELRAPLLLLIDAVNRLADNLHGRNSKDVSNAISMLNNISNGLLTLTKAIGPKK